MSVRGALLACRRIRERRLRADHLGQRLIRALLVVPAVAWRLAADPDITDDSLAGPDRQSAGQAPRGLADTGSAVFNSLWTQLYMPCLTLPAGRGPAGLPVGVQLAARRHTDERLLTVALWVEQQLGAGGQP